MISLKCSGSSKKKRRMEDRDVSDFEDHSNQLGTLPQYGQCDKVNKLSAILTSALPGGEHPDTDLASLDRRLLQPPALGQDWALAPTYRCLPTADAIAMDYGLFVSKLPVTIAMSGLRGDIAGNTEDDLPLPPVRTVPVSGQHFLSGPR